MNGNSFAHLLKSFQSSCNIITCCRTVCYTSIDDIITSTIKCYINFIVIFWSSGEFVH